MRSGLLPRLRIAGIGLVVFVMRAGSVHGQEALSTRPLERRALLAEVVRDHPALRAAIERAEAVDLAATAEGKLPPPEVMAQVWQVPITRPYAIDDAQMIMFGFGQTFPAPGARGARERAAHHAARAERAAVGERGRQLRREADHAFADYVEATARHRIHVEHRQIAERALALAEARHHAGGSLTDVAQAEVDTFRMESDVVTDGTRIEGAKARLNALLGREPSSILGPPAAAEAEIAAWDEVEMARKAREVRPELAGLAATREARAEEAHASEREAMLPSFSLAGLYFAPTSSMPQHGYGVNASMSLPWLWGEARAKGAAATQAARAASADVVAARIPINVEIATAYAAMRSSALRLEALRGRALPASRRALDVAWAGYSSTRTDILSLLATRRSVVDVETEIVAARASLDHALAEVDAAVGVDVPRRPLGAVDPKDVRDGGEGHVR